VDFLIAANKAAYYFRAQLNPNLSMKKAISVLFTVSTLFVCAAGAVAQENAYAVSASDVSFSGPMTGRKITAPYGVSSKVLSDFTKRFSNAADVSWTTKDNYTFAYFKEEEVQVRLTYNKSGNLMYTVRYFNAENIPAKYTELMNNNGYNMHVFHVTEIKSRYATTSIVKMEDETSYLSIKVDANGEFSVYESFQKQ
jgi:hypothetical protein